MAMSRSARTYLTLGIVVVFLAIAGAATYFVMTRYFGQDAESTELRGRASVGPTGTASITLETKGTTRYLRDEFPVDIVLNTGNKQVTGGGLRVSYTAPGTTAGLDVVDADPTRGGAQIISFASQNLEGCSEQFNTVSREAATGRMHIDFGFTCPNGYNSNGNKIIATILFRANTAGTYTLDHDPSKAIITDKDTGNDTLTTIPALTLTIAADSAAPLVELTTDTLITRTDGKFATNSASVIFNWKGTEQPVRADDTVLLDQYIEYQYKMDAAAWPTTWTKGQLSATVPNLTHNITTGHTFQVRGRDRNNNISTIVSKNFLVDLTPTISSIAPTHAAGGQQITINGFNFGPTKGTVRFGTVVVGTTAIPTWTDTRIVVTVPATANGGTVQVVGVGRPVSNTIAFALDTNLKIVMNMQGLGQDRGAKKVDVVVSKGTYEARFTGLDATWSTADSAYVVVTPALPDTGLTTAATYVVSVKEQSRLRKKFTAVTITRGAQSVLVKKAAADLQKVGDVNGDNKITILDFSDMVRPGNFTGLSNPVSESTRKYDLNGDGSLTAADISLLLTNYTQLETPGDAEK